MGAGDGVAGLRGGDGWRWVEMGGGNMGPPGSILNTNDLTMPPDGSACPKGVKIH